MLKKSCNGDQRLSFLLKQKTEDKFMGRRRKPWGIIPWRGECMYRAGIIGRSSVLSWKCWKVAVIFAQKPMGGAWRETQDKA